jgi:hypothetical protein
MSVKQRGYQIFSVEGTFPSTNETMFELLDPQQQWLPAKRIRKYHERKMRRKGYAPNIGGGIGTDKELEKAIALSKGEKYVNALSSGEDSDWENDKVKVKPFGGSGTTFNNSCYVPYDKFNIDPSDRELIECMRVTIQ